MQFVVCPSCNQRNNKYDGPCQYCGAPLGNTPTQRTPIQEDIHGIIVYRMATSFDKMEYHIYRDKKFLGKIELNAYDLSVLGAFYQNSNYLLKNTFLNRLAKLIDCDPHELEKMPMFQTDYNTYYFKEK